MVDHSPRFQGPNQPSSGLRTGRLSVESGPDADSVSARAKFEKRSKKDAGPNLRTPMPRSDTADVLASNHSGTESSGASHPFPFPSIQPWSVGKSILTAQKRSLPKNFQRPADLETTGGDSGKASSEKSSSLNVCVSQPYCFLRGLPPPSYGRTTILLIFSLPVRRNHSTGCNHAD